MLPPVWTGTQPLMITHGHPTNAVWRLDRADRTWVRVDDVPFWPYTDGAVLADDTVLAYPVDIRRAWIDEGGEAPVSHHGRPISPAFAGDLAAISPATPARRAECVTSLERRVTPTDAARDGTVNRLGAR